MPFGKDKLSAIVVVVVVFKTFVQTNRLRKDTQNHVEHIII